MPRSPSLHAERPDRVIGGGENAKIGTQERRTGRVYFLAFSCPSPY
jgi:hypothetical protein